MTFDEAIIQVKQNIMAPMSSRQRMLHCGDPLSLDGETTRKLIAVAAIAATKAGRSTIKDGPFLGLSERQLRSIESECGFKIIDSADFLFQSIFVARVDSEEDLNDFAGSGGVIDVRKEIESIEI